MAFAFNINSNQVVALTNKLEKLHRSALPVAIRTALNSTAFDVKKNTMLKSARIHFEERKKNFFRANSKVQMAKGFDVRTMSAVVGFIPTSGSKAIQELEQQERGGIIHGRSLIPMDTARVGKKNSGNVQKKNRISIMPNVVNAKRVKGKNARQKFIKAVSVAGKDGLVLSESNGKEILWRVNSLSKTSEGRYRLTALYAVKKGRSIKVKATHFMQTASLKSASSMERFYIIEAKKQVKRLTGR